MDSSSSFQALYQRQIIPFLLTYLILSGFLAGSLNAQYLSPNLPLDNQDYELDYDLDAHNENTLSAEEIQAKKQETLQVLTQSNNSFAFRFFRTLAEEKLGANLCFSPLNVSNSFWMTYSGARNRTAKEIRNGFQLPLETQQVQENYQDFISQLTQAAQKEPQNKQALKPITNFQSANSLFITTPEKLFSDKFKQGLKRDFQALVSQGNEADMNNWISENTQGQIPQFLQNLDQANAAKNINTLYATGKWDKAFAKNRTRKQDFLAFNWRKVPTDFLEQTAELAYLKKDSYQLINLPMQESSLALQILLPHPNTALSEIEKLLNTDQFNQWQTELRASPQKRVKLSIPKLDVHETTAINSSLEKLGINRIFMRGKADLSGMGSEPGDIYFGENLKSQSTLKIDENQFSFAAATAVSFQQGPHSIQALKGENPPKIHANRPFLYWLVETESNTLLLLGRYLKPEQEMPQKEK